MPFNPESTHPKYDEFSPSWELMRDSVDGEDTIKEKGEQYLPMKAGTAAIEEPELREGSYEVYKLRAEFPEIVAPTIRGSVGTMLTDAAKIELPTAMEYLRENCTKDGLTLDALHRRIAIEVLTCGRYGVLPSVDKNGFGYFATYTAETIRNWDMSDPKDGWVLLDESGLVLDRETGEWGEEQRFRECYMEDGAYVSRVWIQDGKGWALEDEPETATMTPKGGMARTLNFVPFVFINTNDLTPMPDDVPLYGLAKIAVRVYRMDADYSFALHMTSEPTPVAIGYVDPAASIKEGITPNTLGSARIWILPAGGDAKYLEFSGPGLERQAAAIGDSLQRAMVFGAQLFDTKRSAESGEALSLRLGNQHATLKTIAMTSASALETALRNLAIWLGQDPQTVTVKPNLDFADHELSAQDITALVAGWQAGGYSKSTLFWNLQRGGRIDPDRTFEEEEELTGQEGAGLELPNPQPDPRTE